MVLIYLIIQPQLEIRPRIWGMLLWNTWCVKTKLPCLTLMVMVACTGNDLQLPAWSYTASGIISICLAFHLSLVSLLDSGILLFRTPSAPKQEKRPNRIKQHLLIDVPNASLLSVSHFHCHLKNENKNKTCWYMRLPMSGFLCRLCRFVTCVRQVLPSPCHAYCHTHCCHVQFPALTLESQGTA